MTTGLEIAIIGMACRFPGARDRDEFWRNVRGGVESITRFTTRELADAGVPEDALADPAYVRAQGVLAGADLFDAGFFGLSPKEADLVDPQQRALLECAWEALEDAGWDPARVPGPVGVFAGTYYNSYLPGLPPTDDPAERFARDIANEKDYVAARIAYKLDLTGPAVTVQSACSTSLVAVHLAGQALLSGGCDLALAGGATVRARQVVGYHHQPGGIFSADGSCRAFDADADGTVPGNGAGVVVLKRLADALADGDTVHAVILGSAIGNDGADRAGFTAPGVTGQAAVIRAAHAMAGTDPASVGYVETHGSATRLGDPIEVEALTRVFRAAGAPAGTCAIGSVKTNIGHTHAASGVAGLIKAALSVRDGVLPPSLHFTRPNPEIPFDRTPFHVNTELRDWPADGRPRRAGVTSLGMGGTNAHVVLEQPPPPPPAPTGGPARLLVLSARTADALEEATDRLAGHLARTDQEPADVEHTLRTGRRAFAHRRFVIADDLATAARSLATRDPRAVHTGPPAGRERPIAFMFPGLGEQRPGMGAGLYRTQPAFREAVDRCAELLRPELGRDIRELLHPADAEEGGRVDLRRVLGRGGAPRTSELDRTRYAQPAVFVTEYALAQLWLAHGVRPDAMIGYSIGEYVAACLSGVLTLEDALRLVACRARLIDGLPPGAMLAVPLAEDEVSASLPPGVAVAAVNGPRLCVVAGPVDDVAALRDRLAARGVAATAVQTSHAFHSPMMDPIAEEFAELVAGTPAGAPRIPYLSNVDGRWVTAEDVADPAYWVRHLRMPVRFARGVERLWEQPGRLLLEVGPGRTLSSLALQLAPDDPDQGVRAVPSLPGVFDREPEDRFFLGAVGKLWLSGVDVERPAEPGPAPRRVPLPTYPFQRERHWVEPAPEPARARPPATQEPAVADWFHAPAWAPLPPHPRHAAVPTSTGEHWLLLADRAGACRDLADALTAAGHEVTVRGGPPPDHDYDALLAELREQGRAPRRIAYLLGPDAVGEDGSTAFSDLLALTGALGRLPGTDPVDLAVVTRELMVVTGAERGSPEQAAVLGPCRVLPLEHPHLACRVVDIALDGDPTERTGGLFAELVDPSGEAVVALRGRRRWRQVFHRVRLAVDRPATPGRHYVITGGLGAVGLALADHLVRVEHAVVTLIGRTPLPDRAEWPAWLARAGHADATTARIRAITALEEAGGPVLTLAADVTDTTRLRAAFARAARVAPIDCVVHAAGVAGGGLIQLKDPEAAERVLAPKVRGGAAVVELAEEFDVAQVVLCSSTLAVTGAIGQVDYVAGNAVLDALAHHAAARGHRAEVVAVDWDAWRQAGMAHRHLAGDHGGPGPVDHPLLDACLEHTSTHAVYRAALGGEASWLTDEHRMRGEPVVPGTGHLELVRAVCAELAGPGPVTLTDVRFYTPFMASAGRELRVVVDKTAVPWQFTTVSQLPDGRWQAHAAGGVGPAPAAEPRVFDLAAITARTADLGRVEHVGPMGFGPRSRCVRRIHAGEREALAELELPAEFAGDLDHLELHPSLLDLAAGFVGLHLDEEFRVPVTYGELRCLRPMPRRLFSYHRYADTAAERAGRETTTADFVLLDEDGRELVAVDGFVLKRVGDLDEVLAGARAGDSREIAVFRYPESATPAAGGAPLAAHLETGIRPAEGGVALSRVLAAGIGPQVVVCTRDLAAVAADIARDAAGDRTSISRRAGDGDRRRDVLTPYRAPGDELERLLAGIWQELLGVGRVGVDDVFAELGGHSLTGLEVVGRINRQLGVRTSLAELLAAPTVAELAALLRPAVARTWAGGVDA
ncbi:type I polyketide synthase [Saccharothrix obliqua]|uniref:type I polyketide synthase n=1 Tax=Saccharothrix obliqua TaxID=2861747 RepID=UPI001C5E8B45|nr:type I polyketide synthase [Saccharothrix obliqua]MBW4721873.1 SDR family NAD(P)-dependent oxidoreductase [Saccharothrix obliqua]